MNSFKNLLSLPSWFLSILSKSLQKKRKLFLFQTTCILNLISSAFLFAWSFWLKDNFVLHHYSLNFLHTYYQDRIMAGDTVTDITNPYALDIDLSSKFGLTLFTNATKGLPDAERLVFQSIPLQCSSKKLIALPRIIAGESSALRSAMMQTMTSTCWRTIRI